MNAKDALLAFSNLFFEYNKLVNDRKSQISCFSSEEVAYENGKDAMLERVTDDMREDSYKREV